MQKNSKIPDSVLGILKHLWRDLDVGYSSFDSVFNNRLYTRRRTAPSYYHIHEGRQIETDLDVISHAEAVQLIRDGAYGSLAKLKDDNGVTINEHAQHALTDFCSEVYGAWNKYQTRIAQAETICPPLD